MALTTVLRGHSAGLRRRELLWLTVAPLAAVAAVAVGMHLAGMVGGDTAAHVYKTELVRHHQSIVWDNYWYGGSYSIITYGPVYYWLAQYVPGAVIAVVAAGLLPLLFFLYMRRVYGVTGYLPTAVLAVVLAAYLEKRPGPVPAGLGADHVRACAGGLQAAGARRPAGGRRAVHQSARLCGRRHVPDRRLHHPAATAPHAAVVRRLARALAARPHRSGAALRPARHVSRSTRAAHQVRCLRFGRLGLARWSRDPQRRSLQVLFAVFAAACVLSFLVPHNPLGNNVGRSSSSSVCRCSFACGVSECRS